MFRKRNISHDDQLVQEIRKGGISRQRAITQIYNSHTGFVRKAQTRYKLKKEEVIDAYSESIVGLSKQLENGGFKGKSKISTYLYQIFCNKCVDRIRHKATQKNQIEWIYDIPEMPDMAKDILKDITAKEDKITLAQYLDLLGEKCKRILWESEYQGFSLKEIATRLGFEKAQSVANQKHRCMRKLKQLIRNGKIAASI